MANIQDVRAIHTPQKSYEWEIEIQGLSIGVEEDTKFYAKTVSIPATSIEQIAIPFKSTRSSYAGRDASDHTVTVTFWDDEAQTVLSFFQNWVDSLIFNPITGGGTSREVYSANIIIKLLDSTSENATAKVRLGHAFPTEIGEVSLTYESSDPVEISVTFSYDEKEYNPS